MAPIDDCKTMLIAVGSIGSIAAPSNSFLMFLRVKAVFVDKKLVVYVFAFLWIATLGGYMTAPFSPQGMHVGTSKHCVAGGVKLYASAGLFITAANDTLMFLATTYGLLTYYTVNEDNSSLLRSFLNGDGMGKTCKLLMQTGQLYYLYVGRTLSTLLR